MQVITIAVNQKVSVDAVPKDAGNNPAAVVEPITFANSNNAVCTVVQNPNPAQHTNATVFAAAVGVSTVTFSGVNSTGAPVTGQFQVDVVALPANHVDFVFGPPALQ